jgi:hypothetical protein
VRLLLAAAALLLSAAGPVLAQGAISVDALVRAYPEELAGHDATDLIWRDGTRMPLTDGRVRTPEEMLENGTILDMLALPYPTGTPQTPLDDPGRVRNRAFFDKMYGDCHRNEVAPRLVPVTWLPTTWGHQIRITSVNSVAAHLQAVSDELDLLPAETRRFLYPIGGTYNCRVVAGTSEPSMHAWGAAIDINTRYSDYWRWHGADAAYVNRIPAEIVQIFERHGFIWGGRWAHFDTMHFEYRPELLGDEG